MGLDGAPVPPPPAKCQSPIHRVQTPSVHEAFKSQCKYAELMIDIEDLVTQAGATNYPLTETEKQKKIQNHPQWSPTTFK